MQRWRIWIHFISFQTPDPEKMKTNALEMRRSREENLVRFEFENWA